MKSPSLNLKISRLIDVNILSSFVTQMKEILDLLDSNVIQLLLNLKFVFKICQIHSTKLLPICLLKKLLNLLLLNVKLLNFLRKFNGLKTVYNWKILLNTVFQNPDADVFWN